MPISNISYRKVSGDHEHLTHRFVSEQYHQKCLKRIAETQNTKTPRKINTTTTLYLSSLIMCNLMVIVNTPDTLEKTSYGLSFPIANVDNNSITNIMSNTVKLALQGMTKFNDVLKKIDPLTFPVTTAAAPWIPHKVITTTETFVYDDVVKKKNNYDCIIERESPTLIEMLRKISDTLKNPITEASKEAQIVFYFNKYGRCPTENEIAQLMLITLRVDSITSSIAYMLPGSQPLFIAQNVVGPLLGFFLDAIENKPVDSTNIEEFEEQSLFWAKSMINTSPRPKTGKLAIENLRIPNGIYLKEGKPFIKINNIEWLLTMIDDTFWATKENKMREVKYENETWSFVDDENNKLELNSEDIEILCGRRVKRGLNLGKMCSVRPTENENIELKNMIKSQSSGSVGSVYHLNDSYVVKFYDSKIDIDHTSRLKYAINTAKAFSRIYGKNTAKISITPDETPDGSGKARVYVKMLKISGTPLSDITKITDPGELINLVSDLRSRDAIRNALEKLRTAGVKHHDINLANIMYDPNLGFNFIDFDSASFLPKGEAIPDQGMVEMIKKTEHVFNEAYRLVKNNVDIEKMLINHYGKKVKIRTTALSNTHRIGDYKIKEFIHKNDKIKALNHEVGAYNKVMDFYKTHYPKSFINKNMVIMPHIEGAKPSKREVIRAVNDLFKKNMIVAGAHENDFVKMNNGQVIPSDFELIFSKNRINQLNSELKKNIVINYISSGYRYVPAHLKTAYIDIINEINNSLGSQRPTKRMRASALIRSGLLQKKAKEPASGSLGAV